MIRILALNDDLEMCRLLGIVLQLAGYQYSSTGNIDEALSWLREGSTDLLIMYHHLPNGKIWEELYDLLKADTQLSKIGVIILWPRTDYGKNIHNDSFLVTPFALAELILEVERVLRNYGKIIPSIEERQQQFEQNRTYLRRELSQSDEEIEARRRRLLQEAGYEL